MSENKWKKRIHYVLKAAKHFGDEPYMDFFWNLSKMEAVSRIKKLC